MRKIHKKYLNILPVLAWIVWIFILSNEPLFKYFSWVETPSLWTQLRYDWQATLFHVLEYGILAFLIVKAALSWNKDWKLKKILLFTFLFCIFYSFTDEYHQSFIPGRDPSLGDIFFDILGSAIGIWIGKFIYSKKRKI